MGSKAKKISTFAVQRGILPYTLFGILPIREIECTNRQLKTDLNLRPIYHQTDERSEAHLFFGLLAYWVVNNIRVQLKEKEIRHYWKEIVRIMST